MKPVSRTAFYCAGIRAWDASRARPICGDQLAARCMTPAGAAFLEAFAPMRLANAISVTRHRVIDDLLRLELARHPERTVVLVGAGFDTRAFRLPGGQWFEFDARELFAHKEACLPADGCPNRLLRVDFDFETEALVDVLAACSPCAPIVIVEGVLPYLAIPAIAHMTAALKIRFPDHVLVADLMTRAMLRTYGRPMRRLLQAEDALLIADAADPAEHFPDWGYAHAARISLPGALAALRARYSRATQWALRHLTRVLYNGYTVNVFNHGQARLEDLAIERLWSEERPRSA